jgi:ABC-type bacteriocin/lantibiotic exporter with double-glycine peptidase domain
LKRQSRSWWCGIASIANALEVLGIKRSQREIARLCHVSPELGCDEVEMKRALLANGVGVDEWQSIAPDCSDEWMFLHVGNNGPVILCCDEDEHWITVIGYCADRYIVFDPSRNQGIEVHGWDSLSKRWCNSEGVYYGIGVSLP